MKLFIKGTLTQIWKPANIFVLIGKWYAEGVTLRTWDMWKVCLQTFRNNRINFLRNLQTSRASNSRILKIKNAKYSGYCFYMNTNIYRDFQICISVPLTSFVLPILLSVLFCKVHLVALNFYYIIWIYVHQI